MPTLAEARLLAEVRCTVADALEIAISYRDPESILVRYAQLLAEQAQRQQHIHQSVRPVSLASRELWTEASLVAHTIHRHNQQVWKKEKQS